MMENQQPQSIKVVEMAKKRRHIHLLEKLQRGKSSTPSLSKNEIRELEDLEQDPNSPGTVDSQEKVAKVFGVHVRTVARWVKNGMPVTAQGKYDLLEVRAWRTLKHQKKGAAGGKKNQEEFWDAKFREYKAKLAEISLKKSLGELIPRETVERDLVQISLTVKRAFLALPRQVAPQLAGLDPRQIEALLSIRINEIISKFADGKIFIEQSKKKRKKDAEAGSSDNLE
jgi:phage terminase Nu1 subunit (DNA packaging protein)